ncbi:unnamed protein product [Moneuplotes crassus]|uniref:Uncharacterized protein n=1 Tax=Euplotes crassus TaxID=5936 RepID=A0AAD2CZW6_EUPCR|nr:unnamed protein product [Moneuplotes crassus]
MSTLHYLTQISAKVTDNGCTLTYDKQWSSFKIRRLKAKDLGENTIVINDKKNITVEFEQGFFDSSEVTNTDYVVKITSSCLEAHPVNFI